MDLKKFISGISALSIAASAFAAVTITANAAATEVDYIGTSSTSETYTGYTVNTPVNGSWSADSFTTSFGTATATGIKDASSDNVAYIDGSAFTVRKRGGGTETAKFTLNKAVTNGKVYFKSGIGINGEFLMYNSPIKLLDSTGAVVLSVDHTYRYAGVFTVAGSETKYTTNQHPQSLKYGYYVSAVLDLDTNKATVTIDFTDKNNAVQSEELTVDIADTNIASLTIDATSTSSRNTDTMLDNTQFYAETVLASTADYTVNYVYNNNTIYTTQVTDDIGAEPNPDMNVLTVDGQKYVCVSNDAGGKTIAGDGSTVVTVMLRLPNTYNASITSSIDNSVIDSQSGVSELDTVYLYHHRYIVKNGNAYITTTFGGDTYKDTLTYDNPTIQVNYDANAHYTNVVYFSEGEDIDGFSICSDTARMSGGQGGYGTTTIPLSKGKYVAYVASRGGGSAPPSFTMTAGETTIFNAETIPGTWAEKASAEFTLTTDTDVAFTASGASNKGIDYILIRKTGDVPTAVAELVQDNIAADEGYTGEDAGDVYSVFKATVTAGTNAITSLKFTLNSGLKETSEYTGTIDGEAIFGLVVPMASSAVEDITAVIDGVNYVAFE